MGASSDNQLRMAAAIRTFGDDDLAVNTFFELGYVRDDADHTVSLRQTHERLMCLAKREESSEPKPSSTKSVSR